MNFYDLLRARTEIFGEKTFLNVDNREFSYKNFLQAVDNGFDGGKFFSQAKNFFATQKNNRSNVFEVTTSGSSGTPKKFFRTFESWTDFFPTQNKIFRINADSKLFMHGSLSFTGNLNAFLAAMDVGATIITSEKFSPRKWHELLSISTNIYLVPTKLTLLLNFDAPIKNIRSIFTGSQVLTANQSLNLLKKFPNAELILYYGASELSFVTYKKISAENAFDVQNLGKPFDGVKIFIRDGKIYVDTPFHAENIQNPATVGDFGRMEDGNLIFFGRGEDFINRGGVKIFASVIEQKISALEGVESVAVVKIPDKLRGENFIAFIVGKIDKKIIRQALSPAELPKIVFVKSLPVNSSGKIDKKSLLEQVNQLFAD